MSEDKRTIQDLQQLQALPLNLKVSLTKSRIRAWINEYGKDGVYVSFSGGKDSTVLLDIVRQDYPDVPAVFCNTGLEFPEILQFVKTKENVVWLRPKMTFREIVEKYGYPMFGKEICETVYGARRYLTELRKRTENPSQTDRRFETSGRTQTSLVSKDGENQVLQRLCGSLRNTETKPIAKSGTIEHNPPEQSRAEQSRAEQSRAEGFRVIERCFN